MYYNITDILKAESDAIKEVIDFSDEQAPEDYGLERIRGIIIMTRILLDKDKEGG